MQEKQALSDTLSSLNGLINMLNYAILQSNDQDLRNIFITYRNNFENAQYEIYKIAKQHGYYVPAAAAGNEDIQNVITEISN